MVGRDASAVRIRSRDVDRPRKELRESYDNKYFSYDFERDRQDRALITTLEKSIHD